jgi:hypothetical protein
MARDKRYSPDSFSNESVLKKATQCTIFAALTMPPGMAA